MEKKKVSAMDMVPTITPDEIKDFITAKTTNKFCPICAKGDWEIMGGPGAIPAIVGMDDNGGIGFPARTIPLVVLACTHCAYIRLHSLGMISAWKSSGKPQ
jgi:hypothetical protein